MYVSQDRNRAALVPLLTPLRFIARRSAPAAAPAPQEAAPSTRLILLSLPSHLTPSTLRAALSAPASAPSSSSSPLPPPPSSSITDLKLYSSRHFAFVGYKTSEEAERCRKWWDGAYLEGTRIKVEFVQDGVDKRPKREKRSRDDHAQPSIPADDVVLKGTSKRLKKSSGLSTDANALTIPEGRKRNRNEQQKDEFLELFTTKRASASDSNARTWEDGAPAVEVPMEAVEEQPEPVEEEKEDEGAMDDEAWAKKFMTGNLEEAPTKEVQVVKADTSSRPAGADEDQDVRLSLRNLPNA